MPIYISRGRFTSDAVKVTLFTPENREEAVSKLFEISEAGPSGWSLTFGRHDWLVIGEFPDDKACASAILAAAAGGSLSDIGDNSGDDGEGCSRHFRIRRKSNKNLPERRARIGSGGRL